MTALRQRMHMPIRALARWTGRAEATLRAMEAGTRPIPAPLAAWLAELERWVTRHPPPPKTK